MTYQRRTNKKIKEERGAREDFEGGGAGGHYKHKGMASRKEVGTGGNQKNLICDPVTQR